MSQTNSILVSTGQNRGGWPVLLLFLAAILIPTTCILWFMNIAVQNEQLAVHQRLVDVYTQQLITVRHNFIGDLNLRLDFLADSQRQPAPVAFSQAITRSIADSLLILSPDHTLAYPAPVPFTLDNVLLPKGWNAAQQLEQSNPAIAAVHWKNLAAVMPPPNWRAAALRNEARALAASNQFPDAINLLAGQLQSRSFSSAIDPTSTIPNLIAPSALFRALQLQLDHPQSPGNLPTPQLIQQTRGTLERYDAPFIPSSQRSFLLQQFQHATNITSPFLAAEQLASPFIHDFPIPSFNNRGLTSLKDLYALVLPTNNMTTIALFKPKTVDDLLAAACAKSSLPPGIRVTLQPNSALPPPNRFAEISGDLFPAFRLYITSDDSDIFTITASRQKSVYLWTAFITIAAILTLGLLLALYTSRQLRITRLKNDLIATVSHELKTPLASMRLLVDTLLEHRTTSPQQSGEYLALISRENSRLTRLIDNFLTFSRMERNKHRFSFAPVNLPDLITEALTAIPERAPFITTQIDAPPESLTLNADHEALLTLLLNLLDNAWKYSNDPRQIHIHASRTNSHIHLAISDNGIGIPPRLHKKIFKRFYQVDQSLTRKTSGTGLGLSIVQFIATVHHATISVQSTPQKGSTFTLTLPINTQKRENPTPPN